MRTTARADRGHPLAGRRIGEASNLGLVRRVHPPPPTRRAASLGPAAARAPTTLVAARLVCASPSTAASSSAAASSSLGAMRQPARRTGLARRAASLGAATAPAPSTLLAARPLCESPSTAASSSAAASSAAAPAPAALASPERVGVLQMLCRSRSAAQLTVEPDTPEPASEPFAGSSHRCHRRWRARGGEVCSACASVQPAHRWGYTCTMCAAVWCSSVCQKAGFELHRCSHMQPALLRRPWQPRRAAAELPAEEPAGVCQAELASVPHPGGRPPQGRHPAGRTLDDLLADVTARPALNTLEHIPGHHRLRCADIFRDLFSSHAAAEKAATKGGAAAHAHALRAARPLWAAPALLLRTCRAPRDDVLSPPTAPALAKGAERSNIVRARLQHAEMGDWEKLLSDSWVDRDASDALALARARGQEHAAPLEAQPDEDASVFMKASAKVEGHALRSETDLLLGARRAPLDENTACEVDSLVAVPITREEEFNQRAALAEAKALSRHVAPVPHRLVRRRPRLAKMAAQPGPSGWRNGFLAAVGEARGGVAALSRWTDVWRRAMIIPETATLWTAACVCPLDAGSAAVEPGAPPKRKIQPIALSEAPLKLVEGAAVDLELSALLHVLEPRQLGCGTPDGAGLAVRRGPHEGLGC